MSICLSVCPSTLLLFVGNRLSGLIVMLPGIPLVPQELRIHPFGGGVAVLAGLLDAVLVGLVRLIVSCVILRLRHLRKVKRSCLR